MIELNRIYNESCLDTMARMPDGLVDATITSPPYNVGIDYGNSYNDSQPVDDYFNFISTVAKELLRVTVSGGRACINVPFTGNSYFLKKSQHLNFYPRYYIDLFEDAGWIFRDFVIWVKTSKPEDPDIFCGNSTQWGSWLSPSCPYLRCFAEAVLVFHKETKQLQKDGIPDITKDEFLEFTKNVWYFPAESDRLHPAPFPVELPTRCIKLYTWVDSIIYDPFIGSGTTAVAAVKARRNYIGSETNPAFVRLARTRIDSTKIEMSQEVLF